MYRILPEMDMLYEKSFGFSMIFMFISMCVSLFNYRSVLRTVIVLYIEYICIIFSDDIKDFLRRNCGFFRPEQVQYAEEEKHAD
tara:strand:- start:1376 stop:1627 length:252 start_codon:yes stop_codon:yes gene_type:complete